MEFFEEIGSAETVYFEKFSTVSVGDIALVIDEVEDFDFLKVGNVLIG